MQCVTAVEPQWLADWGPMFFSVKESDTSVLQNKKTHQEEKTAMEEEMENLRKAQAREEAVSKHREREKSFQKKSLYNSEFMLTSSSRLRFNGTVSGVLGREGSMFEKVGDWVEKFNGEDFEFWKGKIEDYLCVTGLERPLSGEKPESMDDAECRVLDRMALRTIRSTLSKGIASETAKENTAAGLMATLTDLYELKPTVINQVHLLRQLFKLKMAEDSWNVFVTVVTLSAGKKKLKYDDVRGLVLVEESQEVLK
ncbi:hypothetical protein ACLB2K_028502 [Fragaria x ananassa]